MAHGDHDTVVPVGNARAFAEKLRATSANPVVYAELSGAQHAFDLFHSLRFEAVVDAIEAFAAWVRSRETMPRPWPAITGAAGRVPGGWARDQCGPVAWDCGGVSAWSG